MKDIRVVFFYKCGCARFNPLEVSDEYLYNVYLTLFMHKLLHRNNAVKW